jgi:hypothetical protein
VVIGASGKTLREYSVAIDLNQTQVVRTVVRIKQKSDCHIALTSKDSHFIHFFVADPHALRMDETGSWGSKRLFKSGIYYRARQETVPLPELSLFARRDPSIDAEILRQLPEGDLFRLMCENFF